MDLGPFFYQSGSPESGSITINNGATYSNNRNVILGLSAIDTTSSISQMIISEDNNFAGSNWIAYSSTSAFTLSTGDGTKTVYAKFRNGAGNESASSSDTIILDTTGPGAVTLIAPESASYTNNKRPSFSWKAVTTSLSGIDHYRWEADGGQINTSSDLCYSRD